MTKSGPLPPTYIMAKMALAITYCFVPLSRAFEQINRSKMQIAGAKNISWFQGVVVLNSCETTGKVAEMVGHRLRHKARAWA